MYILMRRMHRYIFFFLLAASLGLSGCRHSQTVPQISQDKESERLGRFDEGEKILAVEDEGSLVLVGVLSGFREPVYQFGESELPPRRSLDTFLVSPSQNYVVWYSPATGIIRLKRDTGETETLHSPSEWFNSNPFVLMDSDRDVLYLVDDEGREFTTLELETGAVSTVAIPFPYGTRFKWSPNGQYIVFVSGYGQDTETPTYLITDRTGTMVAQFSTNARVIDREMIVWLPDSSGLVTVTGDNTGLEKYSIDDVTNPVLWYEEAPGVIRGLESRFDGIYIKTTDPAWKVLDSGGRLTARIPMEIVRELNSPEIYPESRELLLVEETLTQDEETFKRLWRSNQFGNKTILLENYHHLSVVQPEAF